MQLEIDPIFLDVVPEAVARLCTSIPALKIEFVGTSLIVDVSNVKEQDEEILRKIYQILYSTRIYRDTITIRNSIYNG
jgi:hypothetical protein